MRKFICAALFISLAVIVSCGDNSKSKTGNTDDCEKPVMDPNEVKPMAMMMRTMANFCDTMRLKINKGELVDSVHFPLMPFRSAEPTDSSVLEQLFFDNATMFENAWHKLMRDKINQKENYTLVINACVLCHNSYCSGPLRRINKLPLDYKGN